MKSSKAKLRCKLPAYGKTLLERQRYNNLPFLAVICVGTDNWESAKKWIDGAKDNHSLVLTPDQDPSNLYWPVKSCLCIVEWNTGPGVNLIKELVKSLLRHGAISVTVWPKFSRTSESAFLYDTEKPIGSRWVQVREKIRTYYPRQEMNNAS